MKFNGLKKLTGTRKSSCSVGRSIPGIFLCRFQNRLSNN